MKSLYRLVFQFVGKYSDTPVSNIFLYAENEPDAKTKGRAMFEEKLAEGGYVGAAYDVRCYRSSVEEIEQYLVRLREGHSTAREMN